MFRPPVWDSHAFDAKLSMSGLSMSDLADKLKPMVGHLKGAAVASVRAWHSQGREPSCYAILLATSQVLGCEVSDFFRQS